MAAYAWCPGFMCYKVTEAKLKRDSDAAAGCDALFWIFKWKITMLRVDDTSIGKIKCF